MQEYIGSIPELGQSLGVGSGILAWTEELGATVHGVAKNWTQLSALLLLLFSRVQVWVTLWTVAHQAPLSLEVSRSAGVGSHALLRGIFPT